MAITQWTERTAQQIFGDNPFYIWLTSIFADKNHNHNSNYAPLSHNHSIWTSISVNNGTLYVNEAIRMCELHYSNNSFNITTANSFVFVETLSQLADYPITADYLLTSPTTVNGMTVRVYPTGSIQVRNTASGTYAIKFNLTWHY